MLVSKTLMVLVNPVQNPLQWLPVISPFLILEPPPLACPLVWLLGVNKSATRPVESPGTDVKQQNATKPVETPGAGMAAQPVEAPAGPEVLLSGASETALQSDSDYDLQSETGSPVDVNVRSGSPTETAKRMIPLTKTSLKMLPTERQSEGWGRSWVGTTFLSLTEFHLQMTTLLLVPESSLPGMFLLSCLWMNGFV